METAGVAREDRAGVGGHDRALDRADAGDPGEILALASQHQVEAQGDGLALDERLTREGLVALPRGRCQEPVELDLTVLQRVDQLGIKYGASPGS